MTLTQILSKLKSLVYSKTETDTLLGNKAASSHTHSEYVPKDGTTSITGTEFFKSTSDGQLKIGSGTSTITGGCLVTYGSEYSNTDVAGAFRLRASKTSIYDLLGKVNGTLTWGMKNVAMQEDTVPRSGGAVITGYGLARNVDNSYFEIKAGINNGALMGVNGKDHPSSPGNAYVVADKGDSSRIMIWFPNGTWTWNGTACQITSDQRLKQQITQIDNALLDAWEDVTLVQFKYNDAVNEKGDNARLHTGYVVQQIDEACQKHNIDISEYGLYCHEEYPEETEEVEVEQEDETKIKERKVIREASEHYSLRYTETLVVECAFLRREVKRLSERLSKLEQPSTSEK